MEKNERTIINTEALAGNRFHEHRKEIALLAEQRNVNWDDAGSMYAEEQGWTDWGKEKTAWIHALGGSNKDVAKYFAE